MKKLTPALLLTLGACSWMFPQMTEDQGAAGAPVGQPTSTTSPAPRVGELSAPPPNKGSTVTEPGGTSTSTTPTAPTSTPPAVDPTRRFEYAEVTVDLGDPVGMRALVPYLLKPDTWTLVKCEMLSATSKHYKFQKVTSNDGRSLPDVDIFKTRR
jgi:hypothetical protein